MATCAPPSSRVTNDQYRAGYSPEKLSETTTSPGSSPVDCVPRREFKYRNVHSLRVEGQNGFLITLAEIIALNCTDKFIKVQCDI